MNFRKTLKQEGIQTSLFQENNVISREEWKNSLGKQKETKKKRILHEKKFMNSLGSILDQLGLVWIHLRNKCLNTFWHTCPHCKKKTLVTCHSILNQDYTNYPDIMIVAGAMETKHRSYGVKTPKFSKVKRRNFSSQEDLCNKLNESIPVICVNEESQDNIIEFLKDMSLKIQGDRNIEFK